MSTAATLDRHQPDMTEDARVGLQRKLLTPRLPPTRALATQAGACGVAFVSPGHMRRGFRATALRAFPQGHASQPPVLTHLSPAALRVDRDAVIDSRRRRTSRRRRQASCHISCHPFRHALLAAVTSRKSPSVSGALRHPIRAAPLPSAPRSPRAARSHPAPPG